MQKEFARGMKAAIPIALGYLAVSFTLGLAATQAGVTPWQAGLMSLITNTSAGQFAGFLSMQAGSSYLTTALEQVVVNLRYVLMSSGLTQKIDRQATLPQRLLVAFDVTDELFALGISQPQPLLPHFYYGMMAATIPCWALGSILGAALGALMPEALLKAASVALYAMFVAVVVPQAKTSKPVLIISLVAIAISALMYFLPLSLSTGLRVVLLAPPLSAIAAILFPIHQEEHHD